MNTYHVTVHMPSGPWMVTVLAGTPARAIEAAKRQLRAPKGAWAFAREIRGGQHGKS